jgi:hypothetical protein
MSEFASVQLESGTLKMAGWANGIFFGAGRLGCDCDCDFDYGTE